MHAEIVHGRIANCWWLQLVICLCCVLYGPFLSADAYVTARQELVQIIEDDVRATSAYLGQKTLDPRVLTAIATVPRHEFVPYDLQQKAYADSPQPIGYGQTISQPYIVVK